MVVNIEEQKKTNGPISKADTFQSRAVVKTIRPKDWYIEDQETKRLTGKMKMDLD